MSSIGRSINFAEREFWFQTLCIINKTPELVTHTWRSLASSVVFGTQVHGFKPSRSHRIFQGENILSTPSFGSEVKPFVPYRRFTACKRSLNVTWKSGIFRQNSSAISRPSSTSFHYQGLWWRHLAVQV